MLVDQNSTDIKIIDFGLAKRYNPKEEIKVLSGTPAFAGDYFYYFIFSSTDGLFGPILSAGNGFFRLITAISSHACF